MNPLYGIRLGTIHSNEVISICLSNNHRSVACRYHCYCKRINQIRSAQKNTINFILRYSMQIGTEDDKPATYQYK